jgi:membrane protein implicated in regulation of membrane protease activity
MDYGPMILHLGRVAMGGIAAFLAIYLWSQTRDVPWMLVIMGIVLRYLEIAFSTLAFFGIIDDTGLVIARVVSVRLLLENLPYLFYSAALILMIRRQRFR